MLAIPEVAPMTFTQKAVEAAARAIYENWANYPACDQSKPWEFICEERNPQADDFRRKAKAALTAALAVDGLALVPTTPNSMMVEAAGARVDEYIEKMRKVGVEVEATDFTLRVVIYQAMIPAANDGEERR